jgi:F plasmid transfer operon, TraF, protein
VKQLFKSICNPLIVISTFVLAAGSVHGQSFGQYDSRAVAMGGATVANANTAQAPFYNPALLSFHDEYEETTTSGRVLFPVMTTQISESVFDVEQYASDDKDEELSNAIDAYNAAATVDTALNVVTSASDVQSILDTMDDSALNADLYVGFSISEPSKHEGGAFFLGFRALAGGRVNTSDDDRALLNDYIEGLTFISTNGQQGVAHPELFDGNGNLLDNSDNLNSSYRASAVTIVESGVTLAKELSFFSYPVSVGISPKLWIVETYANNGSLTEGLEKSDSDEQKTNFSGNMDLGFATRIGSHWQFGLVVKDIFTQTYETDLGGSIKIEPKARLGGAYVRSRYQIALDVDLNKTDPFDTQQTSQDVALGVEWELISRVFLRGGYRHDIQSIRAPELSLGAGYQWRRIQFDVAYAQGDDSRAASLQFGYAF